MQSFPPSIVIRHRKENLKKCSLKGMESREDFLFFSYPNPILPDLSSYLVLTLNAPPLSSADSSQGLLLLDATWRYAEKMLSFVKPYVQPSQFRSLPSEYRTAYPREQTDCPNPETGLASIEALYLAYALLGRDVTGLLENYYWKKPFLEINQLNIIDCK